MDSYLIKRARGPVSPSDDFTHSEAWKHIEFIELKNKYGKSISNAPRVRIKLQYDDTYIYGLFLVHDKYVYLNTTEDMQQVCKDSCVEIFIQPKDNIRYYNFEFSGNGHMLLYNITHCRSKNFTLVTPEDLASVIRRTSLPARMVPECKNNLNWTFYFAIPIAFFVKYGDNVNPALSGQTWRANITKCADDSSHPHWLSWQKLSKLDFHLPECFGELTFE